jgi:transcriptional regulator with XRE-family HTH domain
LPSTTTSGGDVSAARLYDHELLRAWREQAGLSRERVGVDLSMGASWLALLEQGGPGRTPSLALLIRLARYYGHEPGELLAPRPQ